MILVPKAIIYKCAMMVKALYTLVTIVAMHCIFRSEILTVDANIIKMQLFFYNTLHHSQKVLFKRHITWVNQSHAVKEYS